MFYMIKTFNDARWPGSKGMHSSFNVWMHVQTAGGR